MRVFFFSQSLPQNEEMKHLAVLISFLAVSSLSCTTSFKSTLRSPSAAKPKLTYPLLIQYLKDHRVTRIADLVDRLAIDYPTQVEDFALVYNSLSLHESSFRNPRVLLYGPDATLFLSYNGHSSQRGYSKLEIMHKEPGGKYFFREISLEGDGILAEKNDPEIEMREPNFTVSKPNIGKCTRCHGTPAMPIWEPYAIWPGVYGSLAEATFDDPKSTINRNIGVKDRDKDIERDGLTEFLKFAPSNDRYKQLVRFISIGNNYRPLANLNVKLYGAAIEDILDAMAEKMRSPETLKAVRKAMCGPYENRSTYDLAKAQPILQDIFDSQVDRFNRLFYDYKGNLRTLEIEKSICLPAIQALAKIQKKIDPEVIRAATSETSSNCGLILAIQRSEPIFKAAGLNLREFSMTMRRSLEFENGGSFMNSTLDSLSDLLGPRLGMERVSCLNDH